MNDEIKNLYAKLDRLRPFMNGRGKEVAEIAGLEYSTYMYYMRGIGKNPDKIRAIITAGKKVAEKMSAQIEQL